MFFPDDLFAVIPTLSNARPVFHSEADFQHALAWQIHLARPDLRIRLETRPAPGIHLDMLITDPRDNTRLAVELKYLTDAWAGEVDNEAFNLLRHSASDVRAYDCVKDISRVEKLIGSGYADAGGLIVLSNDPGYWVPPKHGRITNADAFRLHEGRVLSGLHEWGPKTGAGTMAGGRTHPLELIGTYRLHWNDYSRLPGMRGLFRCLELPVSVANADA